MGKSCTVLVQYHTEFASSIRSEPLLACAMAMPSAQIMQEWTDADATIGIVFEWAGITGAHQEAIVAKMECEIDEPMTTGAMIKETEVEDLIGEGTDEGPYPLAAKGRIRRAFKAMRMAGGMEAPPASATPPLTNPAKAPPPTEQVSLNGVIV